MKGKILLLAIPLLFACSSKHKQDIDPTIKHHGYEEVSDKTINWAETFNKGEDEYCVYYFSRTCQYCDSIRDEVIDIALVRKTLIYFCNDNAIVTDKYLDVTDTIGKGNINEFRIGGFPSIIKVNKRLVSVHCTGKSAVLDFIRNIA